jgi:predicted double-glycine peptidase
MKFYRQTTAYTGAAAALLMVLHQENPDEWPLTRESEFRIWHESANLPTRSSSIYALAKIAKSAGLTAQVVVEEREYDYPDYRFKRYKKVDIDDAKFSSKQHAKSARKAGVKIEERELELTEIKTLAKEGKLLLLRVNAGVFRETKATSRYVLVAAYDGGTYQVLDPAQGELRIDEQQMEEAFETLTTKKKRDHRVIIIN